MTASNSQSQETLKETARNLFFLFGCGRSGTSLLRSMLSQHPEMVVANETQFYHTFYKRYQKIYGELDSRSSFNYVLNKVLSYWSIRELELDHNKIHQLCDAAPPNWETMMLAIFSVLRTTHGACCVGDKNPSYFQYLELLKERYPEAKYIHIVRDPRAVCLSFRNIEVGPSHLSEVLDRWSQAVDMHFKYQGIFTPEQLHLVRYEDLVTNTELELEKICEFLKLEFSTEMLQFHHRKQEGFSKHQSGHQGNTLRPLFQSSIDKWRTQLTPIEIGLIEFKAGDAMQKLGYQLTGNAVSVPQLRLAFSHILGQIDRCGRWLEAKRRQRSAA